MLTKFLTSALVVGAFTVVTSGVAQNPPPAATGYAWADACSKCHEVEYASWARTKHATAFERLSSSDQEKECIGCHVTGAKGKILEGNKIMNKGIQCEACHGPAAAHVADPSVRTGLITKPSASLCEECHSAKGPHFKGFWFDAMKGLVHKMK